MSNSTTVRRHAIKQLAMSGLCTYSTLVYAALIIGSIFVNAEETEQKEDNCYTQIPLSDQEKAKHNPAVSQSERLTLMMQQLNECTPTFSNDASPYSTQGRKGNRSTTPSPPASNSPSTSSSGSSNTSSSGSPSSSTSSTSSPSSGGEGTNDENSQDLIPGKFDIPLPTKSVNHLLSDPTSLANRKVNLNKNPNGLNGLKPQLPQTPQINSPNTPESLPKRVLREVANTVLDTTIPPPLTNPWTRPGDPDKELVIDDYTQTLIDAYEEETDPQRKAELHKVIVDAIKAQNAN